MACERRRASARSAMEFSDSVWMVGGIAAVLGGALVVARLRRRPAQATAELVRRRNALRDELRTLIPDAAERDATVRAASKRLRVSETSIEAYESALASTRKTRQEAAAST